MFEKFYKQRAINRITLNGKICLPWEHKIIFESNKIIKCNKCKSTWIFDEIGVWNLQLKGE